MSVVQDMPVVAKYFSSLSFKESRDANIKATNLGEFCKVFGLWCDGMQGPQHILGQNALAFKF